MKGARLPPLCLSVSVSLGPPAWGAAARPGVARGWVSGLEPEAPVRPRGPPPPRNGGRKQLLFRATNFWERFVS